MTTNLSLCYDIRCITFSRRNRKKNYRSFITLGSIPCRKVPLQDRFPPASSPSIEVTRPENLASVRDQKMAPNLELIGFSQVQ